MQTLYLLRDICRLEGSYRQGRLPRLNRSSFTRWSVFFVPNLSRWLFTREQSTEAAHQHDHFSITYSNNR